ncbi:MAG: VWA domain-containing protein, partial [Lachnospiraceae bacterium]|nr:VWA domain-containing protein [Lachnospiraceae bacterium]
MKRFNWKKILSLVLVLALVVGTLTWNKRAAGAASGDSHPTKVETKTKDGIKITKELKNLQILDGNNAGYAIADIELTVDGAKADISKPTTGETAIVFVMDLSSSMKENASGKEASGQAQRIYAARNAAKAFAEGVLTEENKKVVSIGIASFGKKGHNNLNLSNEIDKVTDAIDKLEVGASENNSSGTGTNLQAGINTAKQMLEESDAANKIIILLSDGQPTYSY